MPKDVTLSSDPSELLSDPYVSAQPESLPFWEAAAQGRLVSRKCTDCDKVHWHPRTLCPFCGGVQTEWVPLSGYGTVHAFSELRRANPPYTVAYVQLAEGPMMLTNLVEMGEKAPAIGMRVKVVFEQAEEGRSVPKFTAA